jgi:hypothetical protein
MALCYVDKGFQNAPREKDDQALILLEKSLSNFINE